MALVVGGRLGFVHGCVGRLERNRSSARTPIAINQFPHHTCSLSSTHRPVPFLLVSHPNVWSAVSSASGSFCPATGNAAASRRLEKCPAIREQCDTQLLRRLESDLFRPAEPSVKVSAAIGCLNVKLMVDRRPGQLSSNRIAFVSQWRSYGTLASLPRHGQMTDLCNS
jgi:hypothetical protein